MLRHTIISSGNNYGLYNSGTVDIEDGYFSYNWRCAISNDGYLTGDNVEIIYNYQCGIVNSGTMNLNRLTIRDLEIANGCATIVNDADLTLTDSASIDNPGDYPYMGTGLCNFGNACFGVLDSAGYNLIDDLQGCSVQEQSGDLLNVDGQLHGVTGANPPFTPLLPGSPAIDAGNPAGCTDDQGVLLPADQRGIDRLGR